MTRARAIALLVVAVLVAVGAILALVGRDRAEPPVDEQAAEAQLGPGIKSVALCFPDGQAERLVVERREIVVPADKASRATKILEELAKGPGERGVNAIPEGAHIRSVVFDGRGGAYIDFTKELQSKHPGGSAGEMFTIHSVVRTMSLNFPDIETVQFLVDGDEIESIAGHIDASRPFRTLDWR